ncbi:MAG: cysteine synthase A [Bacteroidaceae bacterium]|nr:cysteine synthase A [Bacteroidaceae bacterium]
MEIKVGSTPLIKIERTASALEAGAFFGKFEAANPAGSIKDRVALEMILDAEQRGLLKSGATIIEPTSGNTGIGLAYVGKLKGYKVILTMPDSMSMQRRTILMNYGAELVLTPAAEGMSGSIAEAERLRASIPGSIILGQFDNPANPLAHYKTTGPEIWEQTCGKVDLLVAGIGTGGTISGTARFLKEQNPAITVVGVEPASSPLLSKGTVGQHAIQGIGPNFVPKTLDRSLIDIVVDVTDSQALDTTALLWNENINVGYSSGAAVWAAAKILKENYGKYQCPVVILPDSKDRY